jgi:RimJ/RimL family protein N-acetyltransferase/precorrin-6B methylase 2
MKKIPNPIQVFSSKAHLYEHYRWCYTPEAIQTLWEVTGLTPETVVADIGAGTGILTREFAGKVGRIYAIEPNYEMRKIARQILMGIPCCHLVAARAEALPLSNDSVDLVTVAQAVQWFEPEAARAAIWRVLKPGGWLALVRNYSTDRRMAEALDKIYPPECHTTAAMIGTQQPRTFYYQGKNDLKLVFPFKSTLNWDAFFGALLTASSAPDEGSHAYENFKIAAWEIFNRFQSRNGLEVHAETELYVGQIDTTQNNDLKVKLREVHSTDLPHFFQHIQDPEALHMAAFTPENPENWDAFQTNWNRIMADDYIVINTILFMGIVAGHIFHFEIDSRTEISYWLGKAFWGKGIATRALSEFLIQVETRPLYARVAKDNAASIRVLEKCGFTIMGEDRGFANAREGEVEEYVLKLN